MATTQKGIYYPDDYTAIADIPEDMKDLAESVDTALGDLEDNIEQNIQPQIDDIEEEQTTQNNNIEALQIENARLKATLPTTTGEGENITLQNTAELEFIQPPLPRGNSEQVQYSGKNLAGPIQGNFTSTGITAQVSDNSISFSGTTTDASTIEFIGNSINRASRYYQGITLREENSVKISAGTYIIKNEGPSLLCLYGNLGDTLGNSTLISDNTSFTITEDKYVWIGRYIANGTTLNDVVKNIQLEKSPTATTFEPYVGGTASPNPSYPQAIQNVTGDVEVLVRDTKIFDKSTIQAGDIINNNATIRLCSRQEMWIKAGTYTFTTNITSPFRYLVGIENIGVPPLSNYPNYIYNSEWQTSLSLTFTINEPGYFTLQLSKTANAQLTVDEVMNFDYELSAHQEQTLPLTLGNIELCKIGTAQDYFYKENGKWYLHKAIGKAIFDGTNVTWGTSTTTDDYAYFYTSYLDNAINPVYNCFCDKLIDYKSFIVVSTRVTNEVISVGGNEYAKIRLKILKSRLNSVDANGFNTWLSNNNITLYYILATPTSTEITDTTLISQLDAISNATSYNEQTNISGTSDESNPLFSVEAYQSIKLILAS